MSQLKQIHAQLAVHGLLSDTLTFSGLISFCSLNPNGDLHYARQLFDGFTAPNRFMYNTLIRAYSNSKETKETLETTVILIRRMMAEGLPPNNFTFPFVLKTFAEALAFLEAVLVHSMIIKTGYGSQVFVMNALLHVYVVCGRIISAHKVFDEIPIKSIVSWNSMIDGYSRLCDCTRAFSLFGVMRRLGLEPDEFSLASLFSVCAQSGNVEMGRLLHSYLLMTCNDEDLVVGNALIDMYGKCGELQSAQTCFDRMLVRNAVSWTSLICAYAKNGLLEFARKCFDQMPERTIEHGMP
ncbi:hypothetical protein HPP92_002157 [Vanilla planifolia]|uniref:Pentatricopeptide repeat-containing protein n=1 Tax=Vanilla planifolia TaxID=51239 RepID=A0A835RSG5_VANPL|nr:hypothetical protein HPP92_002157 [Vanilla planifolia]